MRGENAESMVYYVDKIQELETELSRLRSLRSSDKAEKMAAVNLAKEKVWKCSAFVYKWPVQ